MAQKIPFIDLHSLSEDQRIKTVADVALNTGKRVAFIVDTPKTFDRYKHKISIGYPQLEVAWVGPIPGGIAGAVQKKKEQN